VCSARAPRRAVHDFPPQPFGGVAHAAVFAQLPLQRRAKAIACERTAQKKARPFGRAI